MEPFISILAHYEVHMPNEGRPEYVAYFEDKLKKNPMSEPEFGDESEGENKLNQDNPRYAAMKKSVDDGL